MVDILHELCCTFLHFFLDNTIIVVVVVVVNITLLDMSCCLCLDRHLVVCGDDSFRAVFC